MLIMCTFMLSLVVETATLNGSTTSTVPRTPTKKGSSTETPTPTNTETPTATTAGAPTQTRTANAAPTPTAQCALRGYSFRCPWEIVCPHAAIDNGTATHNNASRWERFNLVK